MSVNEVINVIKDQNVVAQLQLHFGGYSSAGVKSQNQDAFAAFEPKGSDLKAKGAIIAIADGVSSATKAAEAAQLAVTQFIEQYYSTPQTWSTRKSAAKVLTSLNSWLYSQTDANSGLAQQWLTTFSALVIKSSTGYLFHLGDTRISVYKNNRIETITNDHNRKQGVNNAILTRALGADPRLQVDVHQVDISPGDIFLLTCDGVHDYLSAKYLQEQLATLAKPPSSQDLERLSKQLTEQAIKQGSDDNVSCVLVYVNNTPNRKSEEIERNLLSRRIPPALNVGNKLDGYKIVKVIHASHRSHLYLAEYEGDTSPVVLKVPSQNFAEDPIYLQGFMREAWVGERINHSNVMQVKSDQKDSRFLYHVCEYIEGQTLTQWMHDHPKPSIAQVRDIISQVIAALRTFQRLELVHRDLKPDNIMIDRFGHIKLIDYGTALIASLDENNDVIEETVPQGTLNYIAPETLLSLTATNLSDIFSLGVICYEMLSGELPFKPMQQTRVTQTQYSDWQYRSIKQFRPDLPIWLDLSLQQCTHPDPKLRYQAFSELAADLEKPNLTAVEEYKKQPILQRNPVKFWQGMSFILFISLLISVAV
ncbi:bifunctional protein-serine/threonine kinase/phosphatase [Thalassomonas sp. M1454]|uniref:bifunctional protein-serine/threonine kinase/phosphatase n=1 Tax=Thalassomonas sp. M1454 TaxID=2594477 RepID=UPI00117BE8B5|nr:bifunctional protein-serine/threonine kinase/phosphatase [Thalassomonas sp. M1454]TRX53400.1 bifunctional protein-serine/threonine kinase/phosphatase [Thalassomonas sp. M1454]